MDRPKYHIDIFWSEEDGGYIANVPDLRYCSAFGETPEDALREVLVAMELHLDTLDELGRPIPGAQARPTVPTSGMPKTSAGAQFEVYRDSNGEYRWRFRAADGEMIIHSGEGYASRDNAVRAIRLSRSSLLGRRSKSRLPDSSSRGPVVKPVDRLLSAARTVAEHGGRGAPQQVP